MIDEFSAEVAKVVGEFRAWMTMIDLKIEPEHLDAATKRLNRLADIEKRILRGNSASFECVRSMQENIKILMDHTQQEQALKQCRAAPTSLPQRRSVTAMMNLMTTDILFHDPADVDPASPSSPRSVSVSRFART